MVPGIARRLGVLAFVAAAAIGFAVASQPAIYVTWNTMEPDKCATIWLIRKHIDADAEIIFFKPDDPAPPGILFDTPDAEIRRTHNLSAFEAMAARYGLHGDRIEYIGRVIHDIEINTWQRKALKETRRIESVILSGTEGRTPSKAVDWCVSLFEGLTVPSAEGSRSGS